MAGPSTRSDPSRPTSPATGQGRSATPSGDRAGRATRRSAKKSDTQDGARRKKSSKAVRRDQGLGRYLPRPDTTGPRVRLGILWFLLAIAGVVWGRWATGALWASVAAVAALQVTRAWSGVPRAVGANAPVTYAPILAAVSAAAAVGLAAVGTSAAGVGLIAMPFVILAAHMLAGRKPAAAGAALIGFVLAAVPAVAMVIVVRAELWAGLFLVIAVSFYDAGYYIGGAESTSRLEGPITGIIGVLAVTFAASAIQAAPFDRVTAWMAGGLVALACPLGQMLVAADLPRAEDSPVTGVGAMRRLDAYLVAAPLMLASVWSVS